jgi:GntR family transcriptional regulator, histidine utilization repressor
MTTQSGLPLLDRQNALPLYQQIKHEIVHRVDNGVWCEGQRIPSENALVESLGVSRMTINRALRELTQEGLLNRVHGLGTFVAERQRHASLITLNDIADEVRADGRAYRLKVLSLKTVKASARIARRMQLSKQQSVFRFQAVHFRDDTPVQYEDRFVNPVFAPDFPNVDFSLSTATSYLISLFKPDEIEHVVRALLPEPRIASLLQMPGHEACLQLSRRTWKNKQVVTDVSLNYPGDRYELGERYTTDDYQLR